MERIEDSKKLKISIIIPCFNEERFLPLLFSTIENLSIKNISYEVILVDNGSSDKSVEIAREYRVTVLIKTGVNISALRNLGAECARGEIFAFLDADCLPKPYWLNEAEKYIKDSDVGLFGSIPLCPKDGTWVERAWIGISPKGVNEVGFICTANMLVKQNVFAEVHGFDESLHTGEDYDICQRIIKAGYKIVHDERITVIHLRYPKTLIERFKKEIWYGEEMFKIILIKPFYRPFWASLVFGCSFFTIILCVLFGSFGFIFYFHLTLFVSLAMLSATFKVIQTKRYKYWPQLILLYFIYLAGRFSSILKVLKCWVDHKINISI